MEVMPLSEAQLWEADGKVVRRNVAVGLPGISPVIPRTDGGAKPPLRPFSSACEENRIGYH